MKTATYTLPNCFLSYLFNSDPSGLRDDDIEALDAFVENEITSNGYRWFHAIKETDAGFMRWHDLPEIGAADCSEITFDVGR